MSETEKNVIVPTKQEVIKNRVFGMPTSKMTRHQRVAFTTMIKIAYDELKIHPDKKLFEFSSKQFFKMIGITTKRKQSYLFKKVFVDDDGWEQEAEEYSLEKTLRELLNKTIFFRYKDKDGKTYKVEGATLLSDFTLTRKKIVFGFSEWIRSQIFITDNAYIMKLPIIASFKSGYTVTLFEQIEQRRDFRRWEISVVALRKIFGLEKDKYVRFGNFKLRVLNVAIDEINTKTTYSLSFEFIKVGRKIEKIIFKWYINKTSFVEFKEFIRKNFVNIPLVDTLVGEDTAIKHLISVSPEGALYNQRTTHNYFSQDSKRVWRWLYENQDKLLVKEQVDNIENFKEDNFAKYYGCNLILDGEMYENIIMIQPTSLKNKLKIKFYTGELLIMSEDDFIKSIII